MGAPEWEQVLQKFPGTEEEREVFRIILTRNQNAFAQSDEDCGSTREITHRIILKNNTPVSAPYRRIPLNQLEEVRQHIEGLLRKGSFVESTSCFASPDVIIKKKDGRIRLGCDYRASNA